MLADNRFPKSVHFNRKNESDQKILEHVKQMDSFSGYVKELILADIEKRNQALKIVHKSENGGIKIVVGR
jgi:hypothetical protein